MQHHLSHRARPAAFVALAAAVVVAAGLTARVLNVQAQTLYCASLAIRHIEVTQATQTDSNSVPLVDGRRTGVRVFATGSPTGCIARAMLRVQPLTAGRQSLGMWSENGELPMKAAYDPATDRPDENSSFNFTFVPNGWTGANYLLTATIYAVYDNGTTPTIQCAIPELSRSGQTTVSLVRKCPPLIGGVQAAWVDLLPPNDQPVPLSAVREGKGDAMMWGVYPFPEYGPSIDHSGGYRVINPDKPEQLPGNPPKQGPVWRALDKYVKPGSMYDGVLMWLRKPANTSYGGYTSNREAWVNVGDGSDAPHVKLAGTHEVGHILGLVDANGGIGISLEEVGWDVLFKMRPWHVRPAENSDFMAYTYGGVGPPADYWTSLSNYSSLLQYIPTTCQRTTQQFYKVSLDPPSQPPSLWTIERFFEYTGNGSPIAPSTTGDLRVDMLNQAGAVIYSTNVDGVACSEGSEPCEEVPSFALLPKLAAAYSVKVYDNGLCRNFGQLTCSGSPAEMV